MNAKMILSNNYLIISRMLVVVLLLLSTSFGSYTFSEISLPSSLNKLHQSSNVFLHKTNARGFTISYFAPASYRKHTVKKLPPNNSLSTLIMDVGHKKVVDLANFLLESNKNIKANQAYKLANIYVEEAVNEGVNPDIAFVQMCLETGFLHFGGDVDAVQNNFCGLGVTGNGVKGLSFKDERMGVRAHIQHLKAYASTKKLNNTLIDTRFNYVKRGIAPTINELDGKWAADKNYGKKITSLLQRLYNQKS